MRRKKKQKQKKPSCFLASMHSRKCSWKSLHMSFFYTEQSRRKNYISYNSQLCRGICWSKLAKWSNVVPWTKKIFFLFFLTNFWLLFPCKFLTLIWETEVSPHLGIFSPPSAPYFFEPTMALIHLYQNLPLNALS